MILFLMDRGDVDGLVIDCLNLLCFTTFSYSDQDLGLSLSESIGCTVTCKSAVRCCQSRNVGIELGEMLSIK